MSKHRRPELPECFTNPQPGVCRWCAEPVLDAKGKSVNRKRCWHPKCAKDYRIACFSDDQRRAVFARDKGVCAKCQKDTLADLPAYYRTVYSTRMGRRWQADHIVPLFRAAREWKFFTLENLQTLCHECHAAKSASDSGKKSRKPNGHQAELL